MTIDAHAHWIPPGLAALMRERREPPRIESSPRGDVLVTFQGRRPAAPLADLDARRAIMKRHGIVLQVLSLASLFGVDCLPVEASLPLTQAFNDEAAAACRGDPRHFAALAALPLADVSAACRELARVHDLGLRGAILPADALASLAAAERYRPLLAIGERLRTHFFVHPGPVAPPPEGDLRAPDADQAWQRRIVLATQARLSEAMVTLTLSGYLDPYPNVTVQVANLGGAIPFLIERMDEVAHAATNGAPPSARLRRCHVDTASFGPRSIALAVSCFGADRVLLGTDCPIFDPGRMLRAIQDVPIGSEARELLLSGNARRIFQTP